MAASGGAAIARRPFGAMPDGTPVELWTLRGAGGATAEIATYGGIVTSLRVPDRRGALGDVVLGHDSLAGYLAGNRPYLGAIVGRYANRIAGGSFALDGRRHALARNDGENHLHGGVRGFDKVVWSARAVESPRGPVLELSRTSPDGEEGYPGNLRVAAAFSLADDALVLAFAATTDRPTLCNLSHHGYFDLDAGGGADILGHVLTARASRFTPIGPGLVPTGELRAVAGTPLDFTRPTAVGARIGAPDEQLALAGGYDHNLVLDRRGPGLELAATVVGPTSGRVMEVLTTEPGMQLYSGNFLDGTVIGKGGIPYRHRSGLCLETQHFPDSPNHPGFPSTVLRPGETYRSTTVYRFSVR
ncbi:MAG TPA: aldose epimerase family protein [Anaeromyxobacter sp.]|nr:aldose epimerase family protein [Anaeromyxobacter sp.]